MENNWLGPNSGWQQLALLPPNTVRVTFTVVMSAERGLIQFGSQIEDWDSDELIGLYTVSYDWDQDGVRNVVGNVWEDLVAAEQLLLPFP